MNTTQHDFVVTHYAPRAEAYVSSAVHSAGADLDQIEAFVTGQADARALDLGCGGGHVSYRAAPHVREVVACDLTPAMLAQVKRTASERGLRNIVVQQAAAERLPFEDGAFDIVMCRYSAHHWNNMEAGLREARRVLKSGGRAIFADAVAPAHPLLDTHLQTIELLRDPSHVRNYSAAEWLAALARSGFRATGLTARKVRLEFAVWTERTKTPELYVKAIRSLQAQASAPVRDHFAISEDGSFELDTLAIEAVAG
ncbi:class I SAM-dependent methyltransferase [Methylocapsa sp. S129]|uniref:class I SAM-dependent methyltransferase n=1 Tax=Methylocapsa sp. S129 TaxID=1641869 RepID=UPI00131D70EA|nr:class I SAM-dependent methyltransferase [Methylocapsa sp. S129]